MTPASSNVFSEVFSRREQEIMTQWLDLQSKSGRRRSATEQQETIRDSHEFMNSLQVAVKSGQMEDLGQPSWAPMRELLTSLSAKRAKGGYSPTETASFVFSLKEPFFKALQSELSGKPETFLQAVWQATILLDKLGLFTMEAFQRVREEVISRQQQELMELSTPVVRLWDNILALPLIGTLDSARTQVVMQNLLEAIVQTRSDYAIIDITGVPVVDTLVAQHLLKTVAAARLMGADCLISGIRPQIAQTIIHLGVDLTDVTTKATLADAFAVALRRSGQAMVHNEKAQGDKISGSGAR
ncbi:MAG TPA: STAS domain-containing protein [Bryobacteraceae bacterium]|nr:STAS domain-containing protein [Bryobacteraceae bacterium]